jgi:hypothetical protein
MNGLLRNRHSDVGISLTYEWSIFGVSDHSLPTLSNPFLDFLSRVPLVIRAVEPHVWERQMQVLVDLLALVLVRRELDKVVAGAVVLALSSGTHSLLQKAAPNALRACDRTPWRTDSDGVVDNRLQLGGQIVFCCAGLCAAFDWRWGFGEGEGDSGDEA